MCSVWSRLWKRVCPAPEMTQACLINWTDFDARLKRIEDNGYDRAMKFDAVTAAFTRHLADDENGMAEHLAVAEQLNKRMGELLKLFPESEC